MSERGQAGGQARTIGHHLVAILVLLALEGAFLALALLFPRWLAGAAPSGGQLFIFFLIGALAGYVAELILRGPRPLGYAGSVLMAIAGAWIGSSVLSRPPAWDWPISTNRGNVAIVTSFSLALLTSLAWRAGTGWKPLSRRLQHIRDATLDIVQAAQGSLNKGFLVGFVSGATVGWGIALAYILSQQGTELSLVQDFFIFALTAAILYGFLRLLATAGFHLFGRRSIQWWVLAFAGGVLGIAAFSGTIVLFL